MHVCTLTTETQYENFNSNYLDKAGYPESANKIAQVWQSTKTKELQVSDSNPTSAKLNSQIARTTHGAMAALQRGASLGTGPLPY